MNLLSYLKTKRIEQFGHLLKIKAGLIKNVIKGNIHKTRPLGWLQTKWNYPEEKDMQTVDKNTSVDLAFDRVRRKVSFVAA
ncbi:Hypothetical protein CINCED_3A007076 [Cinara cedri]|uniref:Uncharacterized protein n=1 Tax=Cinara cedri TaxID=506608 RepID=A0A5E4N5E7_9HEMI|nr:Hypothetical protein CINCED_3A007076 [Cinara cedri]